MTKIQAARQEYTNWCRAIGLDSLDKVNDALQAGEGIELINLSEARQERKYAEVADQISWNRKTRRIVMMSGPSSSGKTSSSLRIAQQARVLGLNPRVIELDNYFVDREQIFRQDLKRLILNSVRFLRFLRESVRLNTKSYLHVSQNLT